MEKIPTARELSEKIGHGEIEMPNELTFVEACMIEFARLHVEAALKVASEKGKCSNGTSIVIKDSILNSYPLEMIK